MEYSSDARQLVSAFTQFRNSINVYTEDDDKDKKFYVTLLKRLFQGTGIIINDVTPLGCCDNVIEACRTDNDSFPKIYIVDGDIDLMVNPKAPIDHLFVLSRYSIENYVIDENAFYRVYDELDYKHDEQTLRTLVDFNSMMDCACVPLIGLFHHFAISQKNLNRFILKDISQVTNKDGEIDESRVLFEKEFVKQDVCRNSTITSEAFDQELSSFAAKFPASRETLLNVVSGKDYLLPYIQGYSMNKLSLKIGIKKEGWKYLYAKYCDLRPLSLLKDAIINEVRSLKDNEAS